MAGVFWHGGDEASKSRVVGCWSRPVPERGEAGRSGREPRRYRNAEEMKAKLQILAAISVFLGAAIQLYGQGYIVPNGVVSNYGGLFFPEEIDVLHDPAHPTNAFSYTGFNLDPRGMTPPTVYVNTFLFDPIADIGVRVFLVSSNDAMSLQPILAHTYTELVPTTYVFNSGQPFYLGLYTGNVQSAPPDGIYNDPLFGWAELVNNRGVIELLDGA